MPSIDGHTRRTAPSLTIKLPKEYSPKSKNSHIPIPSDEITSAPPVCPLFTTKNTDLVVKPIFTAKNLDENNKNYSEPPSFKKKTVDFPVKKLSAEGQDELKTNVKKLPEDNTCCRKKSFTVDYRQPDPTRPLEIRIGGKNLYVDPKIITDASPMICSFLTNELAAGKKNVAEIHLDDLNFEETLEMVKAICPTELGLYPIPVTSKTFVTLARLSYELKVGRLKEACELFIAQLPFTINDVSTIELLEFLNVCNKYGLNRSSKIRLLEGIIGMLPVEKRSEISTQPLKLVIKTLYNEHLKNRLSHGNLTNTAKLKVPCRVCRSSNTNLSPPTVIYKREKNLIPVINEFVVCSVCKHTICQDCATKPCSKKIEEFVIKFIEK